jgi:hypothetical protein
MTNRKMALVLRLMRLGISDKEFLPKNTIYIHFISNMVVMVNLSCIGLNFSIFL